MSRKAKSLDPRIARSRAVIIPAATRHFLADGYVSANLDKIAAEAGVSKRTIYNLFGNKERLFYDVLGEVFATAESYAVETTSMIASADDFESALEAAAVKLAQIVLRDPIIRLRRLIISV